MLKFQNQNKSIRLLRVFTVWKRVALIFYDDGFYFIEWSLYLHRQYAGMGAGHYKDQPGNLFHRGNAHGGAERKWIQRYSSTFADGFRVCCGFKYLGGDKL